MSAKTSKAFPKEICLQSKALITGHRYEGTNMVSKHKIFVMCYTLEALALYCSIVLA